MTIVHASPVVITQDTHDVRDEKLKITSSLTAKITNINDKVIIIIIDTNQIIQN